MARIWYRSVGFWSVGGPVIWAVLFGVSCWFLLGAFEVGERDYNRDVAVAVAAAVSEMSGEGDGVYVRVSDGTVTLTGRLDALKVAELEAAVGRVAGVRAVVNLIQPRETVYSRVASWEATEPWY